MQRRVYSKFYVQASEKLRDKFRKFVYTDGTAKDFAKKEGIGYDVLLDYLNGKHAIPLKHIERLAENDKENFWHILKGEFIRPPSKKNPLKVPEQLTPLETNLLGWVLSEGHLAKNTLQISQKNKEPLLKLKSLLEKCFDVKRITVIRDRDKWKLVVYNSAFRNYLDLKYKIPVGKKSYVIEVPLQIYDCNEKSVAAFLCGCFEGDGDFSFYIRENSRGKYKAPRIGLSSASFPFLLGTKELLKTLGINSKIYFYKKPSGRECHKLSILRASSCINFIYQIRPFLIHPERISNIQRILRNKELLNIIRIKGKGVLFKRLKQTGVNFDEFARMISEQYNYKVVKNTARNWCFDLFAPPLSAIILACELLGENTKDHIPDYLFPLVDK